MSVYFLKSLKKEIVQKTTNQMGFLFGEGQDSMPQIPKSRFSSGRNVKDNPTKVSLFRTLRGPVAVAVFIGSLTAWQIHKAYLQYINLLPSNPSRIGRPDKGYVYTQYPGQGFFRKHLHMLWPDGVSMLERLKLWNSSVNRDHEMYPDDEELGAFASTLDYKAKIAYARKGSDLRMFRRPVEHHGETPIQLVYHLRQLVNQLSTIPINKCHKDQVELAYRHIANSIETVDAQSLVEITGFDAVTGDNIPHRRVTEETVVLLSLIAILAHSRVVDQLSALIELNVVAYLTLTYAKYADNPEILGTILKILANLSVDLSSAKSIESSGCLYILAKAAKDDDIHISFPAKRALQNLDREEGEGVLLTGIYQMYPDLRNGEATMDYDIVFVHGLLGSAFKTWRRQEFSSVQEERQALMKQLLKEHTDDKTKSEKIDSSEDENFVIFLRKTAVLNKSNIPKNYHAALLKFPESLLKTYCEYWPKESSVAKASDYYPHVLQGVVSNDTLCWPKDWLPLDCPNGRILNVDFETFLSKFWPVCAVEYQDDGLESRGKEMLEKLVAAGIGKKPIVFVSHSMGGLIVKHMIVASEASEDPKMRAIAEQTKSVFFYSTPHYGSEAGRKLLHKGGKLFAPTREFEEITGFKESFPHLIKLQEKFSLIYEKYNYKLVSISELRPSVGPYGVEMFLVPRHSSDMGHGENYAVYLDHLNVCKPFCRHSFIYKKLVAHLQQLFPSGGEVNKVTPSLFLSKDSDHDEVCSRCGLGSYGIIDPHLLLGNIRGPAEVEKWQKINIESERPEDDNSDNKKD